MLLRRLLAFSCLALVANHAYPASLATRGETSDSAAKVAERLEELLRSYEQYGFSGSVAVSLQGEIVLADGYGFANRASGERNTADTRYDFASIAKTFTGAAVLALEDDGKLRLDDRLGAHLGAFPDAKSTASVRHLATHTAGLAHRSQSQLDYSTDRQAYVQSMKEAPFESTPGASYRYSNAGTSLLAALAEAVAARPYEEFVRERLMRPAGLAATGFFPEVTPGQPGVALGYTDDSDQPAPQEYDEWTWGLIGATGVVSTVKDIHRWFSLLHSGGVLSPTQTAKAFDADEEEAFGWHTEIDEKGRTFIHKGGGLSAMQSQILAYPDQGVVIVWAHNNMARNWRRALNRGLSAVALGESYLLPPSIFAGRSDDQAASGWWQTDGGTRLELIGANSVLRAGGNGFGLPLGPLAPTSESSWVSFDIERVSMLTLESHGSTLRISLGEGNEPLLLHRTTGDTPAFLPLVEPTDTALAAARQASTWILAGETRELWNVSVYRPLRGDSSESGWAERCRFIAARIGTEARLIDEAWVKRDGSWHYWRTFEGSSGVEVVLRLGVSTDGKILGFGINPRGSQPEFDEKRQAATESLPPS